MGHLNRKSEWRHVLETGDRSGSVTLVDDTESSDGGGESKSSQGDKESILIQKPSLALGGKQLSDRSLKRREIAKRRQSEKLRVIAGKKELIPEILSHVKAGDPQ